MGRPRKRPNDPYMDRKTYHLAVKWAEDAETGEPTGDVSPLCADDKPRAIDMRSGSGETWTIRPRGGDVPRL